ncbi:MAG: glycosyltransferase family 4 protein [Verrucomicrobiae bacterium]|nr:glycosyltransferase family 4 protein [Verrucomicrobiae bacterium]
MTDAIEAGCTKFRVIWSTGGIDHVASAQPRPHRGFKVGYIGTVDYCKLHRNFLKMSMRVNVPDVHFVVCGGSDEKTIAEEACRLGCAGQFTFSGLVDRISDYLPEFDVFGYPLAPTHYGTCDLALAESMAAGVPPVVLGNRMERHMVEDGVTGVVAETEDDYVLAVEKLYRQPEWRRKLAGNARESARKRFSLETMASQWEAVFNDALNLPKTARQWRGKYCGRDISPAQIFIESLGNYGGAFQRSLDAKSVEERKSADENIKKLAESSPIWRSKTRGTPQHYHGYFTDDPFLARWSNLVAEITRHPAG